MRLCTVADVKARKKSLPNVAAIDSTINDAIDAVTPLLEGELNTEFELGPLTHTYRINLVESPPSGDFIELFLVKGFVDIGSPIIVKVEDRIEDFSSSDVLVETEDFHVKAEDGIILLDRFDSLSFGKGLTISHSSTSHVLRRENRRQNFFARVTYTAGFSETAGQFDNVPTWLVEAAVIATIIVLEQQSKVTKTEFGDQLVPKNATAWNTVRSLIDRHGRFFGASIKPLF